MERGIEIILNQFRKVTRFPIVLEKDTGIENVDNAVVFSLNGEKELVGDEGYSLSVTPLYINLSAATPAGVFYGMQTLRQLFPTQLEDTTFMAGKWILPCVEITDKPRFVWRGDLLDVSRHFLPLEFIRTNLDYLARYKMNTFHWHLTDDQGWRIEIKKYPELTEIGAWRVDHDNKGEPWMNREPQQPGEEATYGGYYTQDEIRGVIQYADERFITIVPEIDMPGHSRSTIASLPSISCDGGTYTVATGGIASENTLCPGKEATFEFIENMLDEVLTLFPGEYFHVGGDECNKSSWKECPDCQARIRSEGLKDEDELQSYFIERVEKIVNNHGKKMIGWDEILEGGLAPNAAVMSWRGEQGGIAAAKMGHDVVMTPTRYCYLDLKQGDPELEPEELGYSQCRLSWVYSYDPIPSVITEEEGKHILGTQGNLWGEFILDKEDANYMLFPRLLAIAEVGWSPKENRKWDDFIARLEYNLIRLKNMGVGYAPSMYNVDITPELGVKPGTLKIVLSTEHGSAPISYTLDGIDPNKNSTLYKEPFTIDSTVMIKAAVIRDGSRIGRITSKFQMIHMAAGITPLLKYHPSDQLGSHDGKSLTDCLRGLIRRRSDDSWTAFEGVDMSVTFDLRKMKPVSHVVVGCLERQSRRIFLPEKIEVFSSEDGIEYQLLGSVNNKLEKQPDIRIKDFKVEFPVKHLRFIRIHAFNPGTCPDWHPDVDETAWIFVDEIIVD
jgi:hexosaminidase